MKQLTGARDFDLWGEGGSEDQLVVNLDMECASEERIDSDPVVHVRLVLPRCGIELSKSAPRQNRLRAGHIAVGDQDVEVSGSGERFLKTVSSLP